MAATGELVVEEVAENLEEAAQAVRKLDPRAVGFLLVGLGVGAAVGFYFGYRYNREKIKAEAFRESEEELERIREYYERSRKPDLEELIEERGYVEPSEVVPQRPLQPPVPVEEPKQGIRAVQPGEPRAQPVRTEAAEKDKNEGWNYPFELQQRTPIKPYIIHQDEFFLNESEFQQETLTYYQGDDVLTDTDDTVINNRQNLIGNHLDRFGHGTDDYNVLYIRNPHLEIEYEICRIQKSFEVEVEGLDDEQTNSTNTD